jgi:hypothetical protein
MNAVKQVVVLDQETFWQRNDGEILGFELQQAADNFLVVAKITTPF